MKYRPTAEQPAHNFRTLPQRRGGDTNGMQAHRCKN